MLGEAYLIRCLLSSFSGLNTDKNSQITSSPVKSDSLSIDPKEKKQKLQLVKPLELNHIPVEDKTAESKMLLNPYENNQFDL